MENIVTVVIMGGAMGLSLVLALGLGWSSMAGAFRLMPARPRQHPALRWSGNRQLETPGGGQSHAAH